VTDPAPAAATLPWKLGWLVPVIGVLYAGYVLTNHFPVREPSLLPLTALDRAIPLLPWTVWPYLLLAGMMALPVLLRTRRVFLQAMGALICGYSVNLLIFLAWPTTFPRPELPDDGGLTNSVFAFLHRMDTPANCFPSGHITSPCLGVWAVGRDWPAWRWPLWGVFGLLSLSILTTRQHYVADLAGGLITAWLGIAAERKLQPLRRYE
jgi:hypothetical protein